MESILTTEQRLQKLEKDLAKAKRQNRMLLMAATTVVSAVFLLGAEGSDVQDIVRARWFELVGPKGEVWAELRPNLGNNGPWLSLDTDSCTASIQIYQDKDPILKLASPRGIIELSGDGEEDERPTLWMRNKVTDRRLMLGPQSGAQLLRGAAKQVPSAPTQTPAPAPSGIPYVDQSRAWRDRGFAAAMTVLENWGLPIESADPKTGLIETGWGENKAAGWLERELWTFEWKFTVTVEGTSDDVLVGITGVERHPDVTQRNGGQIEQTITKSLLSSNSIYDKMMELKDEIIREAHK